MITVSLRPREENVDVVTSKIMHRSPSPPKSLRLKRTTRFSSPTTPKNIQTIRSIIEIIDEAARKEVRFIDLQNVQVNKVFNNINQLSRELFNQRKSRPNASRSSRTPKTTPGHRRQTQ